MRRFHPTCVAAVFAVIGLVAGFVVGQRPPAPVKGSENLAGGGDAVAVKTSASTPYQALSSDVTLPDTPAGFDPNWQKDYPQYQPLGQDLRPFPTVKAGDLVPQKLYQYGGRGKKAYASTDDVADFNEFYRAAPPTKRRLWRSARRT